MIKRISRKKLDTDKYSACLNKSVNYRIYAEVFYLDALVGNNWDCYVLNDYEAVMPLPFVKKIGIKFITQPIYCQQLGVFHGENFTKETFKLFEKKLHQNLVRAYTFNEENTEIYQPKGKLKINQIVDLKHFSQDCYSKMVKRNVNQFAKQGLTIKENFKIKSLLKYKSEHKNHYVNTQYYEKLLTMLANHNCLDVRYVDDEDVLGFICFVKSKNRVFYLDSATSKNGRNRKVPTGILHTILQELKGKDLIFDFEGSSIPSISQFYNGFGACVKNYTSYSNLNYL
ncbi:hypothetical protein [Empedobacter brevis]|uniref:hypothetical protein n=1 Tax=Empedobacter brevis TaxID=247 RepID=UPI0039AF15C4